MAFVFVLKSGLNSLIKQDFEDATGSESSFDGADQFEINQMCKNALSGVLSSRKFTFLCKFLVENFEGTKYDQLLNFGIINTRMKQGIYEHSPTLFMVDTEEVILIIWSIPEFSKCSIFVVWSSKV